MADSAQERYEELRFRRDPFLRRARDYAAVTIPSILPPEGHNQTNNLPETYQGFAARCVTNLASRLMTALLPPGIPWFRLSVAPEVLMQAGQTNPDSETERLLALVEGSVLRETERRKWRQPTYTELQHLIVTGNALEYLMPDGTIRVYRLDQYVVARDPSGRLTEIVIEENLPVATLPKSLMALMDDDKVPGASSSLGPGIASGTAPGHTMPLYTWVKLNPDNGAWGVRQEFNGKLVPGSVGDFEINPFNALRWAAVLGEDYGRSKCEEHFGDLKALEAFSKSAIDGAIMASRNIIVVRPNAVGGLNLMRRLVKIDNGGTLVANPEDVAMMQFTNVGGMQFVTAIKSEIEQELASAFLLRSAARRDAERVTAYELQMMVDEIESVLGGVYTSLVADIQEQRIKRLIQQMQQRRAIPAWPEGTVEPSIVTGLEALGRDRDVQRIMQATQILQALPPEVSQYYVKWDQMLTKLMTGLYLTDVVNSAEEAQALQQQAAMAEAQAQMMAQMAGQTGEPEETQ